MVALQLNIDFSDALSSLRPAGIALGDLRMCNVSSVNGLTVRQVAALANTLLGGGSSGYSIADLETIAVDLNAAFSEGTVSAFAQDHLVNGTCP